MREQALKTNQLVHFEAQITIDLNHLLLKMLWLADAQNLLATKNKRDREEQAPALMMFKKL